MEEIPIQGIVVGGVHLGWLHYNWLEMDEFGCIWTVGGFAEHSFCLFSLSLSLARDNYNTPLLSNILHFVLAWL